jgi:hypothetical protein
MTIGSSDGQAHTDEFAHAMSVYAPFTEEEVTPSPHPERAVQQDITPVEGKPTTARDIISGSTMPKSLPEAWSNFKTNLQDVIGGYGKALKINRDFDVPYTAGTSKDSKTLYVDKSVPKETTISNVTFDPAEPLNVHETVEHHVTDELIKSGMDPKEAVKIAHHEYAKPAELNWVQSKGIDVDQYNKFFKDIDKKAEMEGKEGTPQDLWARPYPHDKVEGLKHPDSTADIDLAGPAIGQHPPRRPTPEEASKGVIDSPSLQGLWDMFSKPPFNKGLPIEKMRQSENVEMPIASFMSPEFEKLTDEEKDQSIDRFNEAYEKNIHPMPQGGAEGSQLAEDAGTRDVLRLLGMHTLKKILEASRKSRE